MTVWAEVGRRAGGGQSTCALVTADGLGGNRVNTSELSGVMSWRACALDASAEPNFFRTSCADGGGECTSETSNAEGYSTLVSGSDQLDMISIAQSRR